LQHSEILYPPYPFFFFILLLSRMEQSFRFFAFPRHTFFAAQEGFDQNKRCLPEHQRRSNDVQRLHNQGVDDQRGNSDRVEPLSARHRPQVDAQERESDEKEGHDTQPATARPMS
jgi:hypothetical protein